MDEQSAIGMIEIGDSSFPIWKAAEIAAYPIVAVIVGMLLQTSTNIPYVVQLFLMAGLVGAAAKYLKLNYTSAAFDIAGGKLEISERKAPNIFAVENSQYPLENIIGFRETTEFEGRSKYTRTSHYTFGIIISLKEGIEKTVWKVKEREKISGFAHQHGIPYSSIEEQNEKTIDSLAASYPAIGTLLKPQIGNAEKGIPALFNNHMNVGFAIFGILTFAMLLVAVALKDSVRFLLRGVLGQSEITALGMAMAVVIVALVLLSRIKLYELAFDLAANKAVIRKRELFGLYREEVEGGANISSIIIEKIVSTRYSDGTPCYDRNVIIKIAGKDDIKFAMGQEDGKKAGRTQSIEPLKQMADSLGIKIEEREGKPGFGAKMIGA